MKKILLLLSITLFISCSKKEEHLEISFSEHDLVFDSLAKSWDEGIPLGNGIIGALIWQKGDNLRMSLDNVTLWDYAPWLVPPAYNTKGGNEVESPVSGQDLRRLGYPEGKVVEENNSITYVQEGWGGFTYEVSVS